MSTREIFEKEILRMCEKEKPSELKILEKMPNGMYLDSQTEAGYIGFNTGWQACAEQKDKRIAELTAQNKELVEALNYIHSYMNEFTPDVNSLMFDVVEHTITYTEQALAKAK